MVIIKWLETNLMRFNSVLLISLVLMPQFLGNCVTTNTLMYFIVYVEMEYNATNFLAYGQSFPSIKPWFPSFERDSSFFFSSFCKHSDVLDIYLFMLAEMLRVEMPLIRFVQPCFTMVDFFCCGSWHISAPSYLLVFVWPFECSANGWHSSANVLIFFLSSSSSSCFFHCRANAEPFELHSIFNDGFSFRKFVSKQIKFNIRCW